VIKKNTVRNALFLLLIFNFFSASAQNLCFKSDQKHGHTIKLAMQIMPDGKWAYIRYFGKNSDLKIKLKSEAVKSLINARTPIVVESRWIEYLNEAETGEYRLTTQSAIIGELTYFRKRDGKDFSFYEDKESYGLGGCIWE
jgi:hypothetical protein